jgi:hypothetical protein
MPRSDLFDALNAIQGSEHKQDRFDLPRLPGDHVSRYAVAA